MFSNKLFRFFYKIFNVPSEKFSGGGLFFSWRAIYIYIYSYLYSYLYSYIYTYDFKSLFLQNFCNSCFLGEKVSTSLTNSSQFQEPQILGLQIYPKNVSNKIFGKINIRFEMKI